VLVLVLISEEKLGEEKGRRSGGGRGERGFASGCMVLVESGGGAVSKFVCGAPEP
jgi:hypothetical protein